MARTLRTRWLILLIILCAGGVWIANSSLHFSGYRWNDSQDYNQIARNLYEGKGYSTSVLRPISFLAYKTLPHPEMTRPPLYPGLLALFYTLFGVNDMAVALVGAFFYILFVVMLFVFSYEFTQSRPAALTATACMALSPWFLGMSIQGSSDIVFAAVFMLFLWYFIRQKFHPLLLGMLIGLLYLIRLNALFVALALVVVEFNPYKQKSNWKRLALFCVGGLLITAPSLLRNVLVQGAAVSSVNSSGLVSGGESMPGYTYITQLHTVSTWDFVREKPVEVLRIMRGRFITLIKDFPDEFTLGELFLMLAGLSIFARRTEHIRLKKFVIIIALIQTCFLVISNAEARYYGFLVPALILFVVTYIADFKSWRFRTAAFIAVLLLVLISSQEFWMAIKKKNHPRTMAMEVKRQTTKNDIIISDLAWAVSWYADRKAVWLTYDLDTMDKISEKIPIGYALISLQTITRNLVPYKDAVWQNLMLQPGSYTVPGFQPIMVFSSDDQPIGVLYKIDREKRLAARP